MSIMIAAVMTFAICRQAIAEQETPKTAVATAPTITLEVIRAFDELLPGLSDEDMRQILDVAEKIISTKLSDEVRIVFHDNGVMPLADFFNSVDYRSAKWYQEALKSKYDKTLGEKAPVFMDPEYKARVVGFLKQWDLNSLKDFFPDKETKSYEEAFDNLMAVYHQKIKWQKTLKTKNGEPIIIDPPAPYQSYVEWVQLMLTQNKYDIVITNGFITYDNLQRPYPHSICKHAKVGGSSFTSPGRKPMDGKSLMINIFESYSGVEGISKPDADLSADMKNKIMGAFYFAHEFGHAFYYLPDVYNHGPACLMNTTPGMSDADGYEAIAGEQLPCAKCRPWIVARIKAYRAELAFDSGDYTKAGNLYLEAARETPKGIDTNYKYYIQTLFSKASEAFMKGNNFSGMKKVSDSRRKFEED